MDNFSLSFDSDDLAESLERMSDAEIDALPFGVIRLGADGKVLKYSRREAEQSGYGRDRLPPIGLDFFIELAPCMNTSQFRGQIDQAAATGKVDIEFGHLGDFADRSRMLRIRILRAVTGGFWHLHERQLA